MYSSEPRFPFRKDFALLLVTNNKGKQKNNFCVICLKKKLSE